MQKNIAGFVAILLLGTSPAFGSISVSSSATQPTENLLAYNANTADNHVGNVIWGTDSLGREGHWDYGACFRISAPEDVLLDKVTVRTVWGQGAIWGEKFHLEVWTASWPYYVGLSQVAKQTGVFPETAFSNGYWTFDLDDVRLATNQNYLFVLGFEDGPESGKLFNVAIDWGGSAKLGSCGDARRDANGNWSGPSNYTPTFFIQGSPQNAAVPEPSTLTNWSLLGAAGVAACMWRKRKQPV